MIAAFGEDVDADLLRRDLRKESAEDAYEALRALASSDEPITEEVLRGALQRLAARTEPGHSS